MAYWFYVPWILNVNGKVGWQSCFVLSKHLIVYLLENLSLPLMKHQGACMEEYVWKVRNINAEKTVHCFHMDVRWIVETSTVFLLFLLGH